MNQTQTEQIREYLRQGNSLTQLEALNRFGCMRLGARIKDLRDMGERIDSEIIRDDRTGKRYARYRYTGEQQQRMAI